jgi:hypothetical protein
VIVVARRNARNGETTDVYIFVQAQGETTMKAFRYAFVVLGCVGLLLNGIGLALILDSQPDRIAHGGYRITYLRGSDTELGIGILVTILGPLTLATGCILLAIARGRSWKFGSLGLLAPVGLLFLCVLEDRSLKQSDAAPPE